MILPERIEFNPQRDLLGKMSGHTERNTGKGRLNRPAGGWA
jgi:hypothetical protein